MTGPTELEVLRQAMKTLYLDGVAAAEAGRHMLGIVAMTSAVEAGILYALLREPDEVKARGAWPRDKGDPTRWTLKTLLKVATKMGWIPPDAPINLGETLELVRGYRNRIHPGSLLRDGWPHQARTGDELVFGYAKDALEVLTLLVVFPRAVEDGVFDGP